jgi:UDPglucose--hexose-1-phosphate uridylyltransferase
VRSSSHAGEIRTNARQVGVSGPEFRLDPLTREWVLVVGNRQARPNQPVDGCPFCVGGLEAPDPYEVRAFENRWPAMTPGPTIEPAELDGPGPLPARGATEVLLYSPDHGASLGSIGTSGVRAVVDLWADRTEALLARPEVAYVLVFENRGREVGATIDHPHGQIYAFPFVPPVARREAEVAAEHGCPLCATLPGEIADGSRVVREAGGWVASVPFASGYPFGALVAPVEHVESLTALDGPSRDELAAALNDLVARYDRLFDRPFPYLLWVHPGVHLHVHLAPPLRAAETQRFVASGEVGSGTLSNPVSPEDAAAMLREA